MGQMNEEASNTVHEISRPLNDNVRMTRLVVTDVERYKPGAFFSQCRHEDGQIFWMGLSIMGRDFIGVNENARFTRFRLRRHILPVAA